MDTERTYADVTEMVSLTGLERTANQSIHRYRRAVWALLLIGGVCFLTFHLAQRIQYYLENPTFTKLTLNISNRLPLPGVTVCYPKSPNDALKEISIHCMKIVSSFGIKHMRSEPCHLNDVLPSYDSGLPPMIEPEPPSLQPEPAATIYPPPPSAPPTLASVGSPIHTETPKTSEPPDAFFENRVCRRFNTGKQVFSKQKGVFDGIEIQVIEKRLMPSLGVGDGVPILEQTYNANATLWLHDPNDKEDVPISPASYIHIGEKTAVYAPVSLSRRVLIKDCDDSPGYAVKWCRLQRTQEAFKKSCNCTPRGIDGIYPIKRPTDLCTDSDFDACLNDSRISEIDISSCIPACNEEFYEHRVYSVPLSLADPTSEIIAVIYVYFDRMDVETFTEEAAYDWLTLLCDFGGAFGLYLGACVFSIFQLIDYIAFEVIPVALENRKITRLKNNTFVNDSLKLPDIYRPSNMSTKHIGKEDESMQF